MLKLENGKLMVKGEMNDVYYVVIGDVTPDLMVVVHLKPNKHTAQNGVAGESFTVDILNETVAQVLKEEGYTAVTEAQVKMLQG